MNDLNEEIRRRVKDAISEVRIDCPDCEYMEDEQYTCTTCWCEGGNGKLELDKFVTVNE